MVHFKNGKLILTDEEYQDVKRDEEKFIDEFCNPKRKKFIFDGTKNADGKRNMIPNPEYDPNYVGKYDKEFDF